MGENIQANLQDVGWGRGLVSSGSVYGQMVGAYDCGMDFWLRKMRGIY